MNICFLKTKDKIIHRIYVLQKDFPAFCEIEIHKSFSKCTAIHILVKWFVSQFSSFHINLIPKLVYKERQIKYSGASEKLYWFQRRKYLVHKKGNETLSFIYFPSICKYNTGKRSSLMKLNKKYIILLLLDISRFWILVS